MQKALVLGGAGFLGSHLCKELLSNDFEVTCIDNLSTGSPLNISELTKNPNFTFIEHDVRESFSTETDLIFNLASPASPPRYQLNPVGTLLTNFQGTLNGLQLARLKNAKFIQASTSEIYGDPLQHPQVETYWGNVNPVGKRSCYDEGKRAAETLCSDFRNQYRVKATIVRIFNTYGPKMAKDDGRVVSNFIVQALEGRDLTIYGDGSQTRSLCFVGDLISAMLILARLNSDEPGPMNLGNPHEISILELAKLIIELTESNSRIVFYALPQDDPIRRNPDITYARNILRWEPTTNLKKGLSETIEFFRQTI